MYLPLRPGVFFLIKSVQWKNGLVKQTGSSASQLFWWCKAGMSTKWFGPCFITRFLRHFRACRSNHYFMMNDFVFMNFWAEELTREPWEWENAFIRLVRSRRNWSIDFALSFNPRSRSVLKGSCLPLDERVGVKRGCSRLGLGKSGSVLGGRGEIEREKGI